MATTRRSPRANQRAKAARDAGLFVRMNPETLEIHPCEPSHPEATEDMNAGERILRGISTPELERNARQLAIDKARAC